MDEPFRWSGEHLTWPELSFIIRDAQSLIDQREIKPRPALLSHVISRVIVVHFLGEDWYARNASENSGAGYFQPDFNPAIGGMAATYTSKFFSVAECLFHLQNIDNARFPIDNLGHARGDVESFMAELLVGMMLLQDKIYFKYIPPIDNVRTPDLELDFHGLPVVADVKCKFDQTEYTPGCLREGFRRAAGQIGSGNKGFIFVKVPQAWLAADGDKLMIPPEIVSESKSNMGRTSRITRAIFYTYYLGLREDGGIANRHAIGEIINPRYEGDPIWERPLFTFHRGDGWFRVVDLIERALHGFPHR